jgi:protein SCO1/2
MYVSDFFFTHCPTICPKVTAQMLRVYNAFKDSNSVKLISFSIDPRHDTVGRLKEYANGLGVSAPKWNFMTGNKDTIYALARDYFNIATDDKDAAGGITHSGRIVLVDKKHHVRAFCDGTDAKDVDRFMKDVTALLSEK